MNICTMVKYIIKREGEKPDVFARQIVPNNCVDKMLDLIKGSENMLFIGTFGNIPQPSKVTYFPAFDRDGNILKHQLIFADNFGDVKYDEKEAERFYNE